MKSSMQNFVRQTTNCLRLTAAVIIMCLFAGSADAQILFTYGKHAVTKDEFLRAYSRNNNDSTIERMSYQEYFDLYSNFRLKVQAALDARMDTLEEQRTELISFRGQLAEAFLKEDAGINILVDEAFERSLKDIHLSQVFIPVPPDAAQRQVDSIESVIKGIHRKLEKGSPVAEAAPGHEYSKMGYITAFTLPYKYENIAYSTPVGKASEPFQTSKGFHLLINNRERKAVGKIRVAQILFAFRPGITEETKRVLSRRADSVYKAAAAGADFATLASRFSDDNLTYQAGGEMPAFGVGQYSPEFENAAFSLAADGEVSKPFQTEFGVHILKRLQLIPVVTDKNNKEWREVLRERVQMSDRMQTARAMLIRDIRQTIKNDAPAEVMNNDTAVLNYYREHLEKYNRDFAEQLAEFRQGNLLFAIMQKKVWDSAAADTAGLRAYYEQHKAKYFWENSADALIITVSDTSDLDRIQALLKTDPTGWRALQEPSNGAVQADSGRFELGQIPVVDRTNFSEGLMTAPVMNSPDHTKTFAYILKMYPSRQPKEYDDAVGSVINDYQGYLEGQWVAALRRKYPVKLNKKVFNTLKAG